MKGVSWNCQGLRKPGKFEFLKNLIKEENLDFISLQETNKKSISTSWLDAISGNRTFQWVHSAPNGRSGGQLVGFNIDTFEVRETEEGEFMLRCLLFHKEKKFEWNFINVYGAAQNNRKESFLRELSSFSFNSKFPMLIGGDFNVIRWEIEKNKLGGVNRWSFLFNAIIAQHNLMEAWS
jgi:exonuclease III